MFVQHVPRNCWSCTCTRCRRFKPVKGGQRKPFICADCLQAKRKAA